MGYFYDGDEPDDLFGDTGLIDTGAVRDILNENPHSKRYFDDGRGPAYDPDPAGTDYFGTTSFEASDYDADESPAGVPEDGFEVYAEDEMPASRRTANTRTANTRAAGARTAHTRTDRARTANSSRARRDVRSGGGRGNGGNGRNGGRGGNGGRRTPKGLSDGAKKKILIAVIAVAAALVAVFAAGTVYYSKHFLPGTHIGFADVSGMTAEEAQTVLRNAASEYSMTIITRGEETPDLTVSGAELGVEVDPNVNVADLMADQSHASWFLPANDSRNIEVTNLASFDENLFNRWYQGTGYFTNDDKIPNEDIPVHYDEEGKQYIAGGVQGDRLRLNETRAAVETAVRELQGTLDLETAEAYQDPLLPEPTSEMVTLTNNLNSYLATTITLDMGADTTEIIGGDVLSQCLSYDSSYNVTFDQEALNQYIYDMEDRYDTIGSTRTFTTHSGGEIEISGGTYGWEMDGDATVAAVMEALQSGQQEVTIPTDTIFTQQGWAHNGPNGDIGDSYIELDMSAQTAYCFIDGEVVWSSSCVTGDVSKHRETPRGVYFIINKEREHIMRGDIQADGSREYETLAHYWMRVTWGGVGFHDGYWRDAFGGHIYYTNGSHGCINLPLEKAAALFDIVYDGIPVVSYGGVDPSSLAITGIAIGSSTGEFVCERGGDIVLLHETQGNVLVPSVKWVITGQTSPETTISLYDGQLHVGADEQATQIVATCTSEQDLTTQASVTIQIVDHVETQTEPAEEPAEEPSSEPAEEPQPEPPADEGGAES